MLTPFRRTVEVRTRELPDPHDVFLCHAWDDRTGIASDLRDSLETAGLSVGFSDRDFLLGIPLLLAIERGLAAARIGVVLVTPALLTRIVHEGVSDKDLSEVLSRDQLVPVLHGISAETLRDVSPVLGSRSGLHCDEESLAEIAAKIAELADV